MGWQGSGWVKSPISGRDGGLGRAGWDGRLVAGSGRIVRVTRLDWLPLWQPDGDRGKG
jgi:hypothetical protein